MAYTGATLDKIEDIVGGQVQEWWYRTTDPIATVLGAGYFSDGVKRGMKLGGLLFVFNTSTNTIYKCVISAVDGGFAAGGIYTATAAFASRVVDSSGGVATPATGISANVGKYTLIFPLGQLSGLISGTRKVALPHAFTVQSVTARVGNPPTTAAKAVTLTGQISGVAMTGGVLALTSANMTPSGATVAGSAITALNVGAAGATVEFALSSVTAFVEGDGWVEVGILNNDLINAIATLAAAG